MSCHINGKQPILVLDDVSVRYSSGGGRYAKKSDSGIVAVDRVSLSICKGEVFGIVGESGCGKTSLARAVVGLEPLAGGRVLQNGREISSAAGRKKQPVNIQMIFQDPYASLNPRMTVFDALSEPLHFCRKVKRRDILPEVARLMEQVVMEPRLIRKYPHEFSGGQRQRIAIARSLAVNPDIIIADEPVSALDVSIQAQILNLLFDLCCGFGLTMIFISHDLSVVRHICSRIAVMYRGRIVETGSRDSIFDRTSHPYTELLLSSAPLLGPDSKSRKMRVDSASADSVTGNVSGKGCVFAPRCPYAVSECREREQVLDDVEEGSGHRSACFRRGEIFY